MGAAAKPLTEVICQCPDVSAFTAAYFDFYLIALSTQKTDVIENILKHRINRLDSEIDKQLAMITEALTSIDEDTNASLQAQFEVLSLDVVDFEVESSSKDISFFKMIMTIISMTSGSYLTKALIDRMFAKKRRDSMKHEAINESITQFLKASNKILEKTLEESKQLIDTRINKFQEQTSTVIFLLCHLLEEQGDAMKKETKQKEVEATIIHQKLRQLKTIETALNNLSETALH